MDSLNDFHPRGRRFAVGETVIQIRGGGIPDGVPVTA